MIEIAMAILVSLSISTNKAGDEFISLQNDSENITYHCEIVSDNYYVDFELMPKAKSRRYLKPEKKYYWQCY